MMISIEIIYSKILLLLVPGHEHLPHSVPVTSLQSVLSSWQEELLTTIISSKASFRALDINFDRTHLVC